MKIDKKMSFAHDNLDQETQEKVNELRKKRDEYNNKASEIQKEIDDTILKYNNFGYLVGKYLKIDRGFDTIYCGPVIEVSRLYRSSCNITVCTSVLVSAMDDSDNYITVSITHNDSIKLANEDISYIIGGHHKTDYVEITKEEFIEQTNNGIKMLQHAVETLKKESWT